MLNSGCRPVRLTGAMTRNLAIQGPPLSKYQLGTRQQDDPRKSAVERERGEFMHFFNSRIH